MKEILIPKEFDHERTARDIIDATYSPFVNKETAVQWVVSALEDVEYHVRRSEARRISKHIYDYPESIQKNKEQWEAKDYWTKEILNE